jgi:phosphoglycerate dehydrogenase-like enzyme
MSETPKPSLIFAVPKDIPYFTEIFSDEARETLDRLGWKLDLPDCSVHDQNIPWREILRGHDGIVTCWASPRLDAETLAQDCRLRIVGHAAGSVAGIVSSELYDRGIKVTSANDLMAQAVADWCLAMTLVGLRRFLEYCSFGAATPLRWDRRYRPTFIQDAKIGIWGFGAVAQHFVRMLTPLRPAEILVHSDYLSDGLAAKLGIRKVGFDEVFAESHVIALLESLTPETAENVGPHQLGLIKDDAVLINCGRAMLTQKEALLKELEKRRFTAIFDVYHEEPLPEDSPLLRMPNVILTPHNAGRPGREKCVPLILEEFERFFSGQPLEYEISRERAATMTRANVKSFKK